MYLLPGTAVSVQVWIYVVSIHSSSAVVIRPVTVWPGAIA